MPASFESVNGKRNAGVWPTREEALAARKKDKEYAKHLRRYLGPRYKLVVFGLLKPTTVTPDVPEHFNHAFGEVVRSRRHLKYLQQSTDSVDYEPSKAQQARDEAARDRMKFEANRR
jgi:hypothetical protein